MTYFTLCLSGYFGHHKETARMVGRSLNQEELGIISRALDMTRKMVEIEATAYAPKVSKMPILRIDNHPAITQRFPEDSNVYVSDGFFRMNLKDQADTLKFEFYRLPMEFWKNN